MKTICLKLSSGEELIGQQQEVLTDALVMKDVHIINLMPVKEGMAISFIPWAMGAGRGTLEINRDHVTSMYEPDKELETGFLNQINHVQIAMPGSHPSIKM